MQQHRTSDLYDKAAAVEFYQERYAHGYMDEWPIEKKRRIFEVVRALELPGNGEAIDFGCGNGVLTDVVRQALPPAWRVYGTDISAIAVENARRRHPNCTFFDPGAAEFRGKKFDFLFTHHVLEHVPDLSEALVEMDGFLKDRSAVLHILPCGNEGSLEHWICVHRKDGIDPQLGNRFFFEDEGHVRRLSTDQVSALYSVRGFVLESEYYSNQYHGSIDWITQAGLRFIRSLVDPSSASDEGTRRRLSKLRRKLLVASVLRFPAGVVEGKVRRKNRTARDYLVLGLGLPLYAFAKAMDLYLKRNSLGEWRSRSADRNGSEMYLFFKRHAKPSL